jgi:AcrR family transcriptional regulator
MDSQQVVNAQSFTDRRTQAERTALSDRRMLESAIRLIVEHGTEKTTLKDVGARAGYSRGLASYRFGSKAGLLSFVVRAIGDEWLRELTRVSENKLGIDAIDAATDAHFEFVREAPDHVRAFYILWFESIGPRSEVRSVIARVHERRSRDVASWIEQGISAGEVRADVSPGEVAEQFSASIIGIVYHWLVNPDALEQLQGMHDGLKSTMRMLLTHQQGQTR